MYDLSMYRYVVSLYLPSVVKQVKYVNIML